MTFGGSPWGYGWGGGSLDGDNPSEEHIPTSGLWTQFDLTGVRQPNDMDRVLSFVEAEGLAQSSGQFFINSFNIASGGAYPTTAALLNIMVPVTETFTAEYRIKANGLPEDFSDPLNCYMLLGATDVGGACATLLLSKAGVAFTGGFHFSGPLNDISYDHLLNPDGITEEERHLFILPGSNEWFSEGQDIYIRVIVDWEAMLTYLYVTPTVDVVEGPPGADTSGHKLVALLPVLHSAAATYPQIDRSTVAVAGTVSDESNIELFHFNMSSRRLVPDLPPRALTGPDQAARLCSIIQLDGTGSFDPEGNQIFYDWRFIDGPDTSQYVYPGVDGATLPMAIPTGFTDVFYSEELEAVNELQAIQPGDVLMVAGTPYTIESTKPDDVLGNFYVVVERPQIPDNYVNIAFKLLRQVGISGRDTAMPTFYPDEPGFYLFDLRVFDGTQWSDPTGLERATTVVNVLESPLPRGCTPNLDFVWNYLSDFWRLLEDGEKLTTFWGGMAQVAATELYTLWQHEYSKSIRDIQRQFARRWLHYDLVLGEPIPELTKVFGVWGGVTSVPFDDLYVSNRTLGISSPAFATLELTLTGRDPVPASTFAAGLQRTLRATHPGFVVDALTLQSGQKVIRINAPFYFQITDATTALFVAGQENGIMSGVGEVTSPRSFKVDRTLAGLNVVTGFLLLKGEAYPIERVLNVEGDEFTSQRVVVTGDLPSDATAYEWQISGWVSSELLSFYDGLVGDRDIVDFEVLQQNDQLADNVSFSQIIGTRALGASAAQPSRLAVDLTPVGHFAVDPAYSVRLARVLRTTHIPVDDLVVDVPTLQEHVVVIDDAETLRRNLDFYIETYRGHNSIRFVSGQNNGPDVFQGQRPPMRLWAEYTYLDNTPTIENNFGLIVGLKKDQLPSNVDYLSAVAGLLYAYTKGPTVQNLRIGTQILLGLPFAEEDGTIIEIRTDLLSPLGRMLIRDLANTEIVRSYTFPKVLSLEINPATGERYKVGDTVIRFNPLIEGVSVVDYVNEPTWFQGIVNQGTFYEVQKYHTFAVRVDGRAFSLSSLLFVRDFILKIKPTYTQPKFIVELFAGDIDGDEIGVNDKVLYYGTLNLEDSVCTGALGASYVFDQPWPGGGQPWAGDPAGHNRSWRNRFDEDNDPTTTPTFPVAENVEWALDKGFLCPSDDFTALFCESFPLAFMPQLDSVFGLDRLTSTIAEATDAGPLAIPAGTTGLQLGLAALIPGTGVLTTLQVFFAGVTGVGVENTYELVIHLNGTPIAVLPVTTYTNTEVVLPLAYAVTTADVVELYIRTQSALAASPQWTSVLSSVSSGATWQLDVMLPAGDYCGTRSLAEGIYEEDTGYMYVDEEDDLIVDDEDDLLEDA